MGMRVDIVTLFPEMCQQVLDSSIIGRAAKKGYIETHCHQIRDYTLNKQKQTDDYPYGGGCGMVLYAQPIADLVSVVIALSMMAFIQKKEMRKLPVPNNN